MILINLDTFSNELKNRGPHSVDPDRILERSTQEHDTPAVSGMVMP